MRIKFLDDSYPYNEHGIHPTKEKILEQLRNYRNRAIDLMKMPSSAIQVELATNLRHDIEDEYSRLDLARFQSNYKSDPFFFGYRKTLVSCNKVTGRLSLKNVHHFLYDVQSYCGYEIARIERDSTI